MAKLKQALKKLSSTAAALEIRERELNELTAFLAVLVDRLGNKVEFSVEDASKLAGKKFDVSKKDNMITLTLN